VPKVQQLLSEYIEKEAGKKVPLGQHLNGEEASALGAALIGANSSSSFRVKKIFFQDISTHEYSIQVTSPLGGDKNFTKLYSTGGPLGGKKKLSFTLEEDFAIKLFEDGVLVSVYEFSGLEEKLNGSWKEYNTTGPPKVTVNVNLETSGLIDVKNPTATIEELYWVNVTKEIPKAAKNASGNATDSNSTASDGDETEQEDNTSANGTKNASKNASANIEYEVVLKQKKKKHEKKMAIKRTDFRPKPLTADQIAEAKKRSEDVAKTEEEVQAVNQMKNDLEATIYGSRDKMERDDIVKVTTEEQREEVVKLCTEYEEWMYEGVTAKAEYESRYTKLQDLLGPMEERALEMEAREDIPDNVKDALEKIHKGVADMKKNKTWFNETKLEATMEKVTEFEEWWTKKQESQKSLPLHEAPAYTKAEVTTKMTKLQKELEKGIKAATKKPKEDKKKAKANATSTADTAKAGSKAKEEPLPTDKKGTEDELAALRAKKAAAVEAEDFDTAQSLKAREDALKAHLQKLEL
jgi:hypoxia up-regulated 1